MTPEERASIVREKERFTGSKAKATTDPHRYKT